jgi:hypothetical protein
LLHLFINLLIVSIYLFNFSLRKSKEEATRKKRKEEEEGGDIFQTKQEGKG